MSYKCYCRQTRAALKIGDAPFRMCRDIPKDPFKGRDEKAIVWKMARYGPADEEGQSGNEVDNFEAEIARCNS